jgi:hypothetical protein
MTAVPVEHPCQPDRADGLRANQLRQSEPPPRAGRVVQCSDGDGVGIKRRRGEHTSDIHSNRLHLQEVVTE